MPDSTISFIIKADTAQGKASVDAFTRSLSQTGPAAEKSISGFRQFEEGLNRRVAQTAKFAAAAAVLAMAGIAAASVKMAVNAVESENLFDVSMGRMGKAARDWSNEVSAALGMNAFEVRKSVGTFNVMLSSMGLTEDAAYDMAKGLTQLTYDMASFYNLSPEIAFQKLQSGISGEIEPLKRLGIIVNEETTNQAAYAAGIAKTGQALTNAQKIQARYIAIMQQTSLAQGDMARTITSPANAMRVLQSRTEQLMVQLGQALIPALRGVIVILGDFTTSLEGSAKNLQTVARVAVIPVQMFQVLRLAAHGLAVEFYALALAHLSVMESALRVANVTGLLGDELKVMEGWVDSTRKSLSDSSNNFADVSDEMATLQESIGDLGSASGSTVPPVGKLTTSVVALSKAAIKTQEEIKKLLETMVEQAATVGMTQAQTELYRLGMLGASSGQIEFAAAVAGTIDQLEAQAEATKTVQGMLKTLTEQAATFGLSEKALAVYQLRMAGATEGEIEFAKAVLSSAEAMNVRKASVDQTQKSMDDYQASMNQLVLGIHGEQSEIQKVQEQIDLLTEGWKRGAIDIRDYEDALGILNGQLDGLHLDETTEHLRSMNDNAFDFGKQMSSSFSQMIIYGKGFGDVMKSLLVLIAEAIIKAYVFKSIAGSLSGSSGFLGVIGSFFGGLGGVAGEVIPAGGGGYGAFQTGGRPPMGELSLVGERGPEWFVPDRPGTIVPIGQGRALGPTTVINNYVDARGADAAVEYRVLRAQQASEARAIRTARLQMQQAALRS